MRVAAVAFCLLLALPAAAETCKAVDGDTLRCGARFEERVRLSEIDAGALQPEVPGGEEAGGEGQGPAGGLVDGRAVTVRRGGLDRYRRTLATVYAGGTDVGAVLVYEGLARWWEGRRESWC